MTITETRNFFDQRATARVQESERAYPQLLQRYFSFLVPSGSRVLELGCGLGDTLAAVKPSRGVGVDFSPATISLARQRHPDLEFHQGEAETFSMEEKFDYIVLSDLINSVPDVQRGFDHAQRLSFQDTRLVVNFINNLWRPILTIAEKLGCKSPTPPQNWLSLTDVKNLLHLAGWEVIKTDSRILWPLCTPLLGAVFNRCLAPLLKHLCLTVFVVARPRPLPSQYHKYSCSVVIPARNEAGNIERVGSYPAFDIVHII